MTEQRKLSRKGLINALRNYTKIEGNDLQWADLCKYTEFDSFATALCFGLNWQVTNMHQMPMSHLRMALFNIMNFPKEQKL